MSKEPSELAQDSLGCGVVLIGIAFVIFAVSQCDAPDSKALTLCAQQTTPSAFCVELAKNRNQK